MEQRKHIAIISPLNRQAGQLHGGITRAVLNLANGFCQRGVRTQLLMAVPPANAVHPDELNPDVELVNLGKTTKPAMVFRITRYLKTEQPDVLLSAGWRYNAGAGWSKRLAGTDTRVWAIICNTLSAEQRWQNVFRRWQKQVGIMLAYARMQGIVAVSKGVADDFCSKTGITEHRVHVIHNPIVSPALIAQGRAKIEHPWFGHAGPPVITALGRLAPQKDFATLIRAFAALRRQVDCRLLILGEGRLRGQLETLVEQLDLGESIDMPGFVKNPFAYLRRSALFVLSSAWEGFGNVVVEALAMGVPVVSTDCPHGPREILDNGRYGTLVNVGDPEGMSRAMLEALRSPVDRSRLKQRALDFEVDRIADRYLKLLQLHP